MRVRIRPRPSHLRAVARLAAARRLSPAVALGLAVMTFTACSGMPAAEDPATVVVVNARVWTADSSQSWAQAVAVRDDTIVAVGGRPDIEPFLGAETTVIDASGGMVVPGFIDTHVHFLSSGFGLSSVQLRDAETPQEFSRRIEEFAADLGPGTWITGGDWDHELWGGELPRAEWIDAGTEEIPVFVSRLDGHMALANSAAMRAAGISGRTLEVDGGTIVRDADGNPAGVFKDNAMGLVSRVIPDPPAALEDRALDAAMEFVASKGVTTVHHMGTWNDLAVFERARDEGRMLVRIYASVPLRSWERLRDRVAEEGRGDAWLRTGGLKAMVDGSLGSHTAAFFEPFTDAPNDTGLLVNTPEDLYAWSSAADGVGLQVNVHAIGDRAIRMQLDMFENIALENGERDRRFRIEHAQHIHPDDIPRFAELGVIPVMQPYHAIDDGRWAERVIGPERIKTTYAFRSLIDAGARPAFGSDWSVAPPTPLEGIYAAVTRRTVDGAHPDGWVPEQKITVEEALRAYTIDAAYASFEEDLKGSLEVGKLADLVILERDLTDMPPDQIGDVRVIATVVGGELVFDGR